MLQGFQNKGDGTDGGGAQEKKIKEFIVIKRKNIKKRS